MKKKLIGRGLLGFPVGIAIGYVITVIISICIGDGFFYPVTPELVNKMGSELNAILIQTALSGIMGTGSGLIIQFQAALFRCVFSHSTRSVFKWLRKRDRPEAVVNSLCKTNFILEIKRKHKIPLSSLSGSFFSSLLALWL